MDSLIKLIDLFYKKADFEAELKEKRFITYMSQFLKLPKDTLIPWVKENFNLLSPIITKTFGLRGMFYHGDDAYLFSDSDSNKTNYLILSKTQSIIELTSERDDLKIINQAFIPGFNGVPKLWVADYKVIEFSIEQNSGREAPVVQNIINKKELQNYLWLLEPFKLRRGQENYDKLGVSSVSKLENFILKNKSIFDEILAMSSGMPSFLGAGIDGIAWDLKNGMVLKIYSDSSLYYKNKEFQENIFKNPALARQETMIYDNGQLNTSGYYTITEKIQVLTDMTDLTAIKSILYDLKRLVKTDGLLKELNSKHNLNIPKYIDKIKAKAKEISDALMNGDELMQEVIKSLESSFKLRPDWMYTLVLEFILKYLSKRYDLHVGNIGYRASTKDFNYFDSYHEGTSRLWIGQDGAEQETKDKFGLR